MKELYANLSVVKFYNLVMRIRGKKVHFGVEKINDVYGLPNVDMRAYETKDCASGSWLVEHLCPGREVLWATMMNVILMTNFISEARIWLSIICSSVSRTTNLMNVSTMRDQMVACLFNSIPLSVGHFLLMET